MGITKKVFGSLANGSEVFAYAIENKNGAKAEILTYGATLNRLLMPDKNDEYRDVVLGFDDLEGVLERSDFQGMCVGRYANRIAGACFEIDGKVYNLTKNEKGITCLHGAGEFSHEVWDVEEVNDNTLIFEFFSPDGSNGFPGNMKITTEYTLSDKNELIINYCASADKTTIINLTNHAYFNLKGYGNGNILDHVLRIDANYYTPTDENSIPIGELSEVKSTPFDFTQDKVIGKEIKTDFDQLNYCRGYDHNFCLNKTQGACAELYSPESGILMETYTDMPGLQLYCGNFLSGREGKKGMPMEQHDGLCLETQYYPDTPNQPDFPQCTFKAGEKFKSTTVYRFLVK
ncbi:MAG TPA: aldose epimerase family protein [Clostridia bacterium]|nr:aldose epimerase family protein [Clostridia bacterium]